ATENTDTRSPPFAAASSPPDGLNATEVGGWLTANGEPATCEKTGAAANAGPAQTSIATVAAANAATAPADCAPPDKKLTPRLTTATAICVSVPDPLRVCSP